jgi:hypothetical protein
MILTMLLTLFDHDTLTMVLTMMFGSVRLTMDSVDHTWSKHGQNDQPWS